MCWGLSGAVQRPEDSSGMWGLETLPTDGVEQAHSGECQPHAALCNLPVSVEHFILISLGTLWQIGPAPGCVQLTLEVETQSPVPLVPCVLVVPHSLVGLPSGLPPSQVRGWWVVVQAHRQVYPAFIVDPRKLRPHLLTLPHPSTRQTTETTEP